MGSNLAEIKAKLKLWECEFSRQNEGKKPDKGDIAQAPKPIQGLYRRYAQLKRDLSSFPSTHVNGSTLPESSSAKADADNTLSSWGGSAAPALTPHGAVARQSSDDSSRFSNSDGSFKSLSSSPWSSGVASKLLAGANLDSLARKSLTPSRSGAPGAKSSGLSRSSLSSSSLTISSTTDHQTVPTDAIKSDPRSSLNAFHGDSKENRSSFAPFLTDLATSQKSDFFFLLLFLLFSLFLVFESRPENRGEDDLGLFFVRKISLVLQQSGSSIRWGEATSRQD